MCEYCRGFNCVAGCPNFDPDPVYHCDGCGEPLYEDDTAYDFGGDVFCEECIENCKFTV